MPRDCRWGCYDVVFSGLLVLSARLSACRDTCRGETKPATRFSLRHTGGKGIAGVAGLFGRSARAPKIT
jgi:hypothetical protein